MGRLSAGLGVAAALALLAGPVAAGPPRRVASLNLCADEIALLLAAPGQLASVTWLAQRPQETALHARAAGLHANRGTVESVAALRPDLIITGGFAPSYARDMAERLGAQTLDLPLPRSIADLEANIRATGAALGEGARAEALVKAMRAALGPEPARLRDALIVQGGGLTPSPDGLTARLLRHAGVQQRQPRGGRATLEALLASPPDVLITSSYRPGETSLNGQWLRHPALGRLPPATRRLALDGRAFLCPGPLAAFETARLRAALAGPALAPAARRGAAR
jgi:iron complex transport system substrate-binding protein